MRTVRTATCVVLLAVMPVAADVEISVDAGRSLSVCGERDDVAQLKRLALNVGSEFGTNRVTDAYLKSLGVRSIRLINVGISGRFDEQGSFVDIKPSPRLERDLDLCRRLNARPHIVIHGMPDQLLESVPLRVTRHRALGIDLVNQRQKTGPTDYGLLENWYLAYFEYVKIQRGFGDAVFEIFNEPDLGTLIYPDDNIPPKGSDAAYNCMFKIYRAAAAAAKRFEKRHPELGLTLGGPAITLAFTYRSGDRGWAKRFVVDCAREELQLDFLGLHHYASVAPFRGTARSGLTHYPSFSEMLAGVKAVIDKHLPGLPIWLTEYGAHHNVAGAIGEINGSHNGASFSLDCLNAMLEQGVDSADYLVTSDQMRHDRETGKRRNVYSWCSFMTSPDFFGYPYPKAPFHTYKMVSELTGKRVAAKVSAGNTRVFATVDPTACTVRVLLWNYATYIPEVSPPIEESKTETVKLSISNAVLPPKPKAVLRMVDKEHGDILSAVRANRPVNLMAAMPLVQTLPIRREGDNLDFGIVLPPGSVAMLEIGSRPAVPSLQTPYSERAELLLKEMRGNLSEQPEKALEAGHELLELANAHPEQTLDALVMLVTAAKRVRMPEKANAFALDAESLADERGVPLPFEVAKHLGDTERGKERFAAAVERYRQALDAPDCDWRGRFGTEHALIDCLNAQHRLREVVGYCDGILTGHDYDPRQQLREDFRSRKLQALHDLGETDQMFATYRKLLASAAQPNAKLGGVITMVQYYRSQGQLDKALAEGKIGIELPGPHPGLLRKLKAILAQIENEKAKAQ